MNTPQPASISLPVLLVHPHPHPHLVRTCDSTWVLNCCKQSKNATIAASNFESENNLNPPDDESCNGVPASLAFSSLECDPFGTSRYLDVTEERPIQAC